MKNIPRPEYPRPQFVREPWMNLNGAWQFEFDDGNAGLKEKWYARGSFSRQITVPYVFQSKLSGIDLQEFHDVVWYSRQFELPVEMKDKRILLHFGAVDYSADVWLNGAHAASHQGGHVGFEADITELISQGANLLVIRAEDYHADLELPRGKQYWKAKSESIFYTGTTGIWQTVWIEAVPQTYLKYVWMTPDLDAKTVCLEYEVEGSGAVSLITNISMNGKNIATDCVSISGGSAKREIGLAQSADFGWNFTDCMGWSPEHPRLFDVSFELMSNGTVTDKVESYFAMRKVSIADGYFMLNNHPYYQKLLLDQGYWKPSLLTAPEDEDFVRDIRLCKEMGFNGVRKHQKVEDPRYLYWADKMGLLVWGEMANAYRYSRKYAARFVSEWTEALRRDYNHPCIVVWTPLNESWGVDGIMNNKNEQHHSDGLYHLTKSIDQTRLVVSNDGWEHTKSDLHTIHDYQWKKDVLKARYSAPANAVECMPAGRRMFAQGYVYEGQPILMTEFGGISYNVGDSAGWGYSQAQSAEDFIKRYDEVISAMLESPLIQGFCYTQLTDVEQEINGLLTYDRKLKVDSHVICQINDGKRV